MKRTDTYMTAGVASLFTAHLLFHDQHMICLPVVLLLISSALFLAAVRDGLMEPFCTKGGQADE